MFARLKIWYLYHTRIYGGSAPYYLNKKSIYQTGLGLYSYMYQLQAFQSKIVENLVIPSQNWLTASRRCETRVKRMKNIQRMLATSPSLAIPVDDQ